MEKLKVLDLFSGIGGFSLGLERTGGFETVAFCEIEDYPRKVLAKHWPEVPCYEDVRKLRAEDVGTVDVICGGYPCQPFSTAGKRRGKEDDRHLWPEFNRLVAELRPAWVIGENVAGHISMGLDDVLSDLEGQGYACRRFVIPACALGAHHRRDRCWTVANASNVLQPRGLDARADCEATGGSEGGNECEGRPENGERVRAELGAGAPGLAYPNSPERGEVSLARDRLALGSDRLPQREKSAGGFAGSGAAGQDVADTNTPRCKELYAAPITDESGPYSGALDEIGDCWSVEPDVGRVADGVPNRLDRLKALGNAVVPQIPEMIGHAILQAEGRA